MAPSLRAGACGATLLLAACAGPALPACDSVLPPPLAVQLVDHGWHTDLAFPADGLTGPLAGFRAVFPGARMIEIGFGKRSFMTAPARGIGDYLVGPLPGDGVLLVTGLRAAPALAYDDGGTIETIPLSRAQHDRLEGFVWASFARDAAGRPAPLEARARGGVFYAATPTYWGFDTCNTWTVAVLHAAGLGISPFAVVLAGQAMARAAPVAAGGMCRISASRSRPSRTPPSRTAPAAVTGRAAASS